MMRNSYIWLRSIFLIFTVIGFKVKKHTYMTYNIKYKRIQMKGKFIQGEEVSNLRMFDLEPAG